MKMRKNTVKIGDIFLIPRSVGSVIIEGNPAIKSIKDHGYLVVVTEIRRSGAFIVESVASGDRSMWGPIETTKLKRVES